MVDIKRAHHYVWRHYLEAWEVDGRLCCLTGCGNLMGSVPRSATTDAIKSVMVAQRHINSPMCRMPTYCYLHTRRSSFFRSLLRDGKAKPINAVNLAVEKDFYRLPELNEAELQFAILFAKSMPSYGEKVFKPRLA